MGKMRDFHFREPGSSPGGAAARQCNEITLASRAGVVDKEPRRAHNPEEPFESDTRYEDTKRPLMQTR